MVTLCKGHRIPGPWLPGTNQPAEPSPGASPTKRLETKAERAVSSGTPPAPPRVESTTIARHRPPTTPRELPFTSTATNRPPTPSFIRPSSFVHLTGPGRQFRDLALSPKTRLAPWSGGGQDGSLEHLLPTTVARADPSRPCTPRGAWGKAT